MIWKHLNMFKSSVIAKLFWWAWKGTSFLSSVGKNSDSYDVCWHPGWKCLLVTCWVGMSPSVYTLALLGGVGVPLLSSCGPHRYELKVSVPYLPFSDVILTGAPNTVRLQVQGPDLAFAGQVEAGFQTKLPFSWSLLGVALPPSPLCFLSTHFGIYETKRKPRELSACHSLGLEVLNPFAFFSPPFSVVFYLYEMSRVVFCENRGKYSHSLFPGVVVFHFQLIL